MPADQFAYDPPPVGPWLGLNGNSDGAWTGAIGDFTIHHIVYDRGGDPGLDWQAGELLARRWHAHRRRERAGQVGRGRHDPRHRDRVRRLQRRSDTPIRTSRRVAGQISSYVAGFIASASAIHERYPTAIFEPMNEPWFFTTPKYNGAEYANVIARLLPAARAAGIPLAADLRRRPTAADRTRERWNGRRLDARDVPRPATAAERKSKAGTSIPTDRRAAANTKHSLGIQSVAEVQKLMSSGQNNIIVSEVGYCARDVDADPQLRRATQKPKQHPGGAPG